MADLKLKFKMPEDETLAKYISIKGEKGDPGDPTKTSQLENDSDFTTNAALNSGLATKADKTTVQSLSSQVDANTTALSNISATAINLVTNATASDKWYLLGTTPLIGVTSSDAALAVRGNIGSGWASDSGKVDIVLKTKGSFKAFGDYYARNNGDAHHGDIVAYEDNDAIKIYLHAQEGWAVFQLTVDARMQATNDYTGTELSTEPDGTLIWELSSDESVQKNINGTISADIDGDAATVNGHTVERNVPYNALFTDTVYDDSSIRDELDNKANSADVADTYATKSDVETDVNLLSSRISALASGSPIAVSSTSEMTDTSKTYVNTSDGKWYYYNGSAWTAGGTYQSTGIGEKTVDYKHLNDYTANLIGLGTVDVESIWELGSYQSSTGNAVTSTSRIRTPSTEAVQFKTNKAYIKLSAGYKAGLYWYSTNQSTHLDAVYVGTSGWLTESTEVEVDSDYYYRVVLARIDNADMTVSEASNITVYEVRNSIIEQLDNDKSELEESIVRSRKYMNHIPQIVMHRGFTAIRSENTLPAYYMCSEYGIKYAKMDVQETADNEFVMSHQEKMESPFVTPADNTYISELTVAQIKQNYYISGPMYDTLYYQKLRMPTMDEALECCRETGLIPMLDFKTGTSYQAFYDKICKYGLQNTACILTSREEVLTALRAIDKDLTLILWGDVTTHNFEFLKNLGGNVGFFANNAQIALEAVNQYHDAGIFVGTYPINDYTEIERVVDCGVDFIQTDQCSRDLKTNFQCKNLKYAQFGNSDFSMQLEDSEVKLFMDYIDLQVEVFYSSSDTPVTISMDGKTLVDSSKPGEWHKVRMQRVKKNSGVMTISVTSDDPEFMYNDLIVRRYIRGDTQ